MKAPDKATLSTLIMRKGKKYGRFVEKRRKKLNEFLQELLDSPHTCDDELFRDFLSPDEMVSDEEDGFDTSDEDMLERFFDEEKNVSTPVPTVTTPRSRPRVGARDVDEMSDGVEEKEEKEDENLLVTLSSLKEDLDSEREQQQSRKVRRRKKEKKKKRVEKKAVKKRSRKDKVSAISPSAVRDILKFTWKLAQELFELYDSTWIYRRTISMVKSMVTTVLEGSAYRTIKRKYDDMFTRESAMYLILKIKRKMWPDGKWREPPPDYTEEEISLHRRLLMETLPKIVPGT